MEIVETTRDLGPNDVQEMLTKNKKTLPQFGIHSPKQEISEHTKKHVYYIPGDSKSPFYSLVRGHLTFKKGQVNSPSQKGHKKSPGIYTFFRLSRAMVYPKPACIQILVLPAMRSSSTQTAVNAPCGQKSGPSVLSPICE